MLKHNRILATAGFAGLKKLGRYNYTVEYKRGVTDVAAEALSRHLDLQSRKAKFVHFSDQRGFPLVSSRIVDSNDMIRTKFERAVRPAHG